MPLKSKIIRAACAFCLVFSMTILAFADTIRLKDGSIIKGKIITFGDGKFTVIIGEGTRTRQLSFNAGEVESISFDTDTTADNSGQTNRSNIPQVSSPRTTATTGTNQTSNDSAPKLEPIKVNVKVSADNSSNGWTNSGWVVQKGQKIRIVGNGRVSLGDGRFATPSGVASLPDTGKLMSSQATGALIAVVGDDNNEFIFVGDSREFTATRDGALFLGVNEGNLDDNSGTFDVRIEIDPSK
ncbi:MAG TPA: LecA/PA-IL family lectin [Pyrinomonadaceae bacterium]|nr:LecA/PA-IL family lectin [Pyrinomonadaceae bacterium]